MPVCAATQEEGRVASDHVLAGERGHVPLHLHLGSVHRKSLDGPVQPGLHRNVLEQFLDRAGADHTQHLAAVGITQRQITHQSGFLMIKRSRT